MTFEEFLQWVSDPEKVQDWYDKFNVILADCFCGQGGKEYYAFGRQTDHYKGDLIEVVAERNHAFYIEPDGRLRYRLLSALPDPEQQEGADQVKKHSAPEVQND